MSASNEDPRDSDKGPSHRINLSSWLTCFGAFTLIYILSIGPVAKLYERRVIPDAAIGIIYAPLQFVYHRFPPAKRFFDWYVNDLWHVK